MARTIFIIVLTLLIGFASHDAWAVTPKNPGVEFLNLHEGQQVSSPLTVKMGVTGKTVGIVGDLTEGVGHHHIIVDGGPIKEGEVIPADSTHIHFGKGQTETELTLTPGKHSLTLQFADGAHRSFGPSWSKTMTVIVK